MRKILFFLLSIVSIGCCAQDCITEKGYIYSPNGFINQTFIRNDGKSKYVGLYTADGKVLVFAAYSASDRYFYVAPGTEVIASEAFSRKESVTNGVQCYWTNVYLPSTVKYIAPDAFKDIRGVVRVYDDSASAIKEWSNTTSEEVEEVARYNLAGIRLESPENGINIIKMSDGSSKKALVK